MALEKRVYKKLPGKLFSLFIVKRLWLGPDHLLWVESTFGHEHYKRFYFKDIQAIILQKTNQHHVWNVIFGILTFFFLIIAFAVFRTPYMSGTLTGICAICWGIHVLRGPACSVYLQTAVQIHKLSTLSRLKSSTDVVNRLKNLIEAKQGRWSSDDFSSTASSRQTPMPSSSGRISPDGGNGVQPSIRQSDESRAPFKPLFHRILFSTMLAAGVCHALQIWLLNMSLAALNLFFLAVTLALAAIAVVRSHKILKDTWLSKITLTTLIFLVIQSIMQYVFYMAVIIKNPDMSYNHWGLLRLFLEMLTNNDTAIRGMNSGIAMMSLVLGIAGIIKLSGQGRQSFNG